MKKALVLLLAMCAPLAHAQLSDIPFLAHGAGSKTCGAYLESRRIPNKGTDYQYAQWTLGFISGFNATTKGPQIDEHRSIETVLAYLDKYCRENPLHAMPAAVVKLIDTSPKRKP